MIQKSKTTKFTLSILMALLIMGIFHNSSMAQQQENSLSVNNTEITNSSLTNIRLRASDRLSLFLVADLATFSKIEIDVMRKGGRAFGITYKSVRAFNVNAGRMLRDRIKKRDQIKVQVFFKDGTNSSYNLQIK